MVKRAEIITQCAEYLGIPWHHQGRNTNGVDCIGYVNLVAKAHHIETNGYQDDPTYGRDPDNRLHLQVDRHLDRIHPRPEQPQPGTVLMFAYGRLGQHLAIMGENGMFYHAYEPEKCVVQTRLDYRWRNRLLGVFDFKGVED